ncbi:DUF7344 domain-containing protein [Natrononativus amylolyticus]|uniref:DUF7344 domain-containing protein n=1 Tax=Natrononativus amylolyticus TaxID=2963434 RepID=UPI0020CB8E02|nr:hypothetical protein [Natrononativus amylolyticus]
MVTRGDQHPGDPSENDDARGVDRLFASLADSRRRHVLYHLADDERVSLTSLARRLVAREDGCGTDEVSSEKAARVETDLRHAHLPYLHKAGLIAYDEESDVVALERLPPPVESVLANCRAEERSSDGS